MGGMDAPVPHLDPQRPDPQRLDPRAGSVAQAQIDELLTPLRAVADARLDIELGTRLGQIVPASHCLCVIADSGATGLASAPVQMHGSMPADLQGLYSTLIGERDPLAMRARQEWRPLVGPIDQHADWVRSQVRHAETFVAWLQRNGAGGAHHLAVVPARGRLTRGTLFVFSARALAEGEVLRAGLKGSADEQIAAWLGLSVDAIRYYFKKFKHRVPPVIGHMKPRDLARVMN